MGFLLKTYKANIWSFLVMVFVWVSSLPIFAETVTMEKAIVDYEIIEMEEDFMEEFEDLGECVDVKIIIYSADNRLVRCCSKENDMVKELIRRADFLANVAGVKFYRLNK